ncbi:MAG TPA: hypothetical protein VMG35_30645, partial [Bryobacteraceae bacterium]|nr:hypothetical protein [Bryobacteraceae bacterium]
MLKRGLRSCECFDQVRSGLVCDAIVLPFDDCGQEQQLYVGGDCQTCRVALAFEGGGRSCRIPAPLGAAQAADAAIADFHAG